MLGRLENAKKKNDKLFFLGEKKMDQKMYIYLGWRCNQSRKGDFLGGNINGEEKRAYMESSGILTLPKGKRIRRWGLGCKVFISKRSFSSFSYSCIISLSLFNF